MSVSSAVIVKTIYSDRSSLMKLNKYIQYITIRRSEARGV